MSDWTTIDNEEIILVVDDAEDDSSVVQTKEPSSEGASGQEPIAVQSCICLECIFGNDCDCDGECGGDCSSGDEE